MNTLDRIDRILTSLRFNDNDLPASALNWLKAKNADILERNRKSSAKGALLIPNASLHDLLDRIDDHRGVDSIDAGQKNCLGTRVRRIEEDMGLADPPSYHGFSKEGSHIPAWMSDVNPSGYAFAPPETVGRPVLHDPPYFWLGASAEAFA